MRLGDFLSTLDADNVLVTLIDGGTKAEIITFKAPGWASLEDELEDRYVLLWTVTGPIAIKVILEPETTEP